MSYYMDPVPAYPALHPVDRLGAMRQSGGMAMAMPISQPAQLPAACHPQQMYPPRPLYAQDGTLQEVPNSPEFCPTGCMRGHPGSGVAGAAVLFPSLRGSQGSWGPGWI
ncbi:hypothetical protein AALO_G00202100 [Alosa alosa]|uniref:Uncharacterized protein n=1 Tax=Alosa alosa TaxID=278164 RepID=A0AAV6G3B8_9TELE|nr:hypothetical protein AALO_G00202100 [Alosa alosa]